MDSKKIGIIMMLVVGLMWALEPVFAKLAYKSADFVQTSASRAIFVMLTALLYVLLTDRKSLKITKTQIHKLVYIGIMGTIVADLLYFYALTKIPVMNAVLIAHLQPVFILIIGYFMLKDDKPTKYDYMGIAVMMAAGLLVPTRTIGNLLTLKLGTFGDLMAFLATAAWASTTLTMRKYLRAMNAGAITFYRYLIASSIFVIYLLASSSIKISSVYQILVGLVVGVGTILYYQSLKRLKAVQVASLELATPFFAAVISFFVLGEAMTPMQVCGVALLFLGVYFFAKKDSPQEQKLPKDL